MEMGRRLLLKLFLFALLAGCSRERSIFFSKDNPEPLRAHRGGLPTVGADETYAPVQMLDWHLDEK